MLDMLFIKVYFISKFRDQGMDFVSNTCPEQS